MEVRTGLFLLVFCVLYVSLGAVVFYVLERNYEEELRQQSIEHNKNWLENHPCVTEDEFWHLVSRLLSDEAAGVLRATNISTARWSYTGSVYYATALITTIGYGSHIPNTEGGRIFSMCFALLGIPCCLAAILGIGSCLWRHLYGVKIVSATCFRRVVTFCSLVSGGVVLVLLLPSAVIMELEGWSYWQAWSYCFFTITTVGQVPHVAGQQTSRYGGWFRLALSVWIPIGLIWVVMLCSAAVQLAVDYWKARKPPGGKMADGVEGHLVCTGQPTLTEAYHLNEGFVHGAQELSSSGGESRLQGLIDSPVMGLNIQNRNTATGNSDKVGDGHSDVALSKGMSSSCQSIPSIATDEEDCDFYRGSGTEEQPTMMPPTLQISDVTHGAPYTVKTDRAEESNEGSFLDQDEEVDLKDIDLSIGESLDNIYSIYTSRYKAAIGISLDSDGRGNNGEEIAITLEDRSVHLDLWPSDTVEPVTFSVEEEEHIYDIASPSKMFADILFEHSNTEDIVAPVNDTSQVHTIMSSRTDSNTDGLEEDNVYIYDWASPINLPGDPKQSHTPGACEEHIYAAPSGEPQLSSIPEEEPIYEMLTINPASTADPNQSPITIARANHVLGVRGATETVPQELVSGDLPWDGCYVTVEDSDTEEDFPEDRERRWSSIGSNQPGLTIHVEEPHSVMTEYSSVMTEKFCCLKEDNHLQDNWNNTTEDENTYADTSGSWNAMHDNDVALKNTGDSNEITADYSQVLKNSTDSGIHANSDYYETYPWHGVSFDHRSSESDIDC